MKCNGVESKRLISRQSECNDLCEGLANINTINKFITRLHMLEIGVITEKSAHSVTSRDWGLNLEIWP